MADFGYDIADYRNVDTTFGTLSDFAHFVQETHRRGMKVILDFVPNHTSDQHPWFIESRSSRLSPKRDWYLWRDAKPDGGPPTNWISNFGGSAWEWDEHTSQYYYHSFLKQQPDLNWRNAEVREAMHDVLRFWLDRGVDGFRIDVLWLLIKDDEFRDNPVNPAYRSPEPAQNALLSLYTADRPEIYDVIAGFRRVVDGYGDRVLIGEIYLPLQRLVSYYGNKESPGVQLPFNFQLIAAPWVASEIAGIIIEYEGLLPTEAWPNWVLGNHDNPRVATRLGEAQARVAATLLLTLRGTPTIYYGEEIGMVDISLRSDQSHDPYGHMQPGLGLGRDPERSPMQWTSGPNAGFTSATPWLPLAPNFATRNTEVLNDDPHSILSIYRRLIDLRRRHSALSRGSLRGVETHGDVLTYSRQHGFEMIVIMLNFSNDKRIADRPDSAAKLHLLFSTTLNRQEEFEGQTIVLGPNEGLALLYETDSAPATD
jgi:alpha-glucosidase